MPNIWANNREASCTALLTPYGGFFVKILQFFLSKSQNYIFCAIPVQWFLNAQNMCK